MTAEINIFMDEGTGHIKYIIENTLTYAADGVTVVDTPPDPVSVVATYKQLLAAIVAEGHAPGREPPRQYGGRKAGGGAQGGGSPRVETPPPDGVPVPEHDGQPCEYKPAWTTKNGTNVDPKFQCRAGAACTEKQNGYPWSIFLDRWLREVNA